MIELIKEYYMISVLCGGISLAFTCFGGWVLIKGIESLKGEVKIDEDE